MTDQGYGDEAPELTRRQRWPRMRARLSVGAAVLAVVLTFAALRYWLPGPELTLAYLKVLVWPTLAFALLFAVRDRLLEKLSDLIEWAGFGQLFKFRNEAGSAVSARASQALGDAAILSSSPPNPAPGLSVAGPGEGPEVNTDEDTPMERAETEQVRRQAVEASFTQGAAWGWDMAQLGFKSRPIPVIEWSEDGLPNIRYGKGQSDRTSTGVSAITQLQGAREALKRRLNEAQMQHALAQEVEAVPGSRNEHSRQAATFASADLAVAQADLSKMDELLNRLQKHG